MGIRGAWHICEILFKLIFIEAFIVVIYCFAKYIKTVKHYNVYKDFFILILLYVLNNRYKLSFGCDQVKYLGHIIEKDWDID